MSDERRAGEIEIIPEPGEGLYRLAHEVRHSYVFESKERTVTVHAGFEFDGASIPKIFWLTYYSPYDPKVVLASLVHDYLYVTHRVDGDEATKREADLVFRDILRDHGVPRGKSWSMWLAVHLFGGRAWRMHSPLGLKAWRKRKTPPPGAAP